LFDDISDNNVNFKVQSNTNDTKLREPKIGNIKEFVENLKNIQIKNAQKEQFKHNKIPNKNKL
jgi:hypothetical protein